MKLKVMHSIRIRGKKYGIGTMKIIAKYGYNNNNVEVTGLG